MKLNLEDPQVKKVWDAVQAAKREVASWPAWKRGEDVGAVREPLPPKAPRASDE